MAKRRNQNNTGTNESETAAPTTTAHPDPVETVDGTVQTAPPPENAEAFAAMGAEGVAAENERDGADGTTVANSGTTITLAVSDEDRRLDGLRRELDEVEAELAEVGCPVSKARQKVLQMAETALALTKHRDDFVRQINARIDALTHERRVAEDREVGPAENKLKALLKKRDGLKKAMEK